MKPTVFEPETWPDPWLKTKTLLQDRRVTLVHHTGLGIYVGAIYDRHLDAPAVHAGTCPTIVLNVLAGMFYELAH